MVNRITPRKDGEGSSQYPDTAAITFHPEGLTSTPVNNRSARAIDDVITALANAHENRRARQVMEWERMRPSGFPLSV